MTKRRAVADEAYDPAKNAALRVQRRPTGGVDSQGGTYDDILNLQRLAGNRAVTSVIQRVTPEEELQAKEAEGWSKKEELARVLTPQAKWSKAATEQHPKSEAQFKTEELAQARAAKAGMLLKGGERSRPHTLSEEAGDVFKKGWLAELRITTNVEAAIDMHGGERVGGDFVQKSTESLEEKLAKGGKSINDSVRYTVTFDKDAFTEGTKNIFRELEKRGFEKVGVRNTFKPGEMYMGVNTNWRYMQKDPDLPSPTFELQFHTPDSYNVKQSVNHPLYEESRKPETSADRKKELEAQQVANSAKIDRPDKIEEIEDYPSKAASPTKPAGAAEEVPALV